MNTTPDLEEWQAADILNWAVDAFGDKITLASSFGAEDIVVMDMLLKIKPDVDIFFLDTGLHFPETYRTFEQATTVYGRTFTMVRADLTLEAQEAAYGPELWKRDPDLCCQLRKVEPLKRYLRNFDAWITGIRREQSPTRANAKKVEKDPRFSLMKINPIADWTTCEVWNYITQHRLPYNPLHDQHYPSIGCAMCTRPVKPGEEMRSGRWSGFNKLECGLHR